LKFKKTIKKNKIERNFGEISNNDDFETRCLSYGKGCGIALIPASQLIDYERANHKQHIESLTDLDRSAK